MLSFELSAIDLILLIAVIILLILYITKLSTKPTAEQSCTSTKVPSEKPGAKVVGFTAEGEKHPSTYSPRDSAKCHYHFGYLKKFDQNAAIPDECLSCPRIMECFASSE